MSTENQNTLPQRQFEDDSIDLKKYFFAIIANWYWFLVSIFICLGIAWLINRYTKSIYQVTSSLLINNESRGKGLSGYENMIPGMEIFQNQKTLLTEIEVLKSSSLAERALKKLKFDIEYVGVGRTGLKESILYNSCPFVVIPDSNSNNLSDYPIYLDILNKREYKLNIDGNFNIQKKILFGESYISESFNFKIILLDSLNFSPDFGYNKYYFQFLSQNSLINNLRNQLSISTNDERRGSVLFLSMVGTNPQQITDYLNRLMVEYINNGLEEKNLTAINTVNFIDQQLEILDSSLKVTEINLQDFRLRNRLVDISAEGNLVYSRLEMLQNERAIAELQTRYYNYLQEYVKNQNNINQIVAPSTIDISDALLSSLIGQLNAQLIEKKELLFTVLPENPKINLIDSKIESTRKALLDNINYLIQKNSINLNEIERQLTIAGKELDKLPVTERMFIGIQRQYKVNDEIYTYWLQKRAEAAIAKAANVSVNKILDFANVDNTVLILPKLRSNYTMGLLIGILFPIFLLILLDLLNNKISNRSEIERKTSMPIIGNIGHNNLFNDIPVFENSKSALAESFRGLRTNLKYLLRENEHKIINITSTISGEGKTFCAVNLATIFAMSGKKTLLVGLDLRKPKIHKIFNHENEIGISTCLIGKSTLTDIIRETKIENLYIAPSGPIPPNPAELLEGSEMAKILEQAIIIFDIIILDTPPMGMVTDALILARQSDLNLFVLRQNYSTKNVLDLLNEIYNKKELGQMGIIMNDIKHKGYYGYGYRYYNYGYSNKYGYYNSYGTYNE